MRSFRIALGQMNSVVGDFEHNVSKIKDAMLEAEKLDCDLVVFPELFLTGYPPEDLLLKPSFVEANLKALAEIINFSRKVSVAAIVGFVDRQDDIYNAAAVLWKGELCGVYHKHFLPNYGVFDEYRYFQRGAENFVFIIKGVRVGVSICEDIWYLGGPVREQALAGDAELLVNISSSPYYRGKGEQRKKMLATRASDNTALLAYCNLVGGQDELVFDGHSLIFDEQGELVEWGSQFEEELVVADLDTSAVFRARLHDPRRRREKLEAKLESRLNVIAISEKEEGGSKAPLPEKERRELCGAEEVYKALVLGTHDYVRKNGFREVVIGLSGGIDSSLTAAIAVDALGAENVHGVAMPSPYSSKESVEDAKALAENLGIKLFVIPIDEVFKAYLKVLKEPFAGRKPDVTEENIQARIRGNILMALSNKFGWLVLATGNKSEMATGYCTLYGDMAGGFAVLKDVPKTLVYELARYRNSQGEVIPERVLKKTPSAELRPNQKDTDTLPPYEVLDPIIKAYVEEDRAFGEIVEAGFDEDTVRRVIKMVDMSEYKRRQGPPGIKITPRAFGKDRRLPITNRFNGGE